MEQSAYRLMADVEDRHWWFVGRRRIVRALLKREFGARVPRKILEVGCGTGGNIAMFREFGDVSASEPDTAAREIATEKTGLTVEAGSLPDGGVPAGGPFDLIAALDVVEHIANDRAAVAVLGRNLAMDGRLLITVPAHPWLWSAHDERLHHYRRYSRTDLLQLFRDAGLRIVRLTPFNTFLFPLAVARRLLISRAGLQGGPDERLPHPAINAMLKVIFSLERFIVPYGPLPFGVSFLVVADRAPIAPGPPD